MGRRRKQKRTQHGQTTQMPSRPAPRLPTELERGCASVGLQLAQAKLRQCRWKEAYEFAEPSQAGNREAAQAIMAEANARQARRSALKGDFQDAQLWARRAVELCPGNLGYRERERLIRIAAEAVLRDFGLSLFPDTVGPGRAHWWSSTF